MKGLYWISSILSDCGDQLIISKKDCAFSSVVNCSKSSFIASLDKMGIKDLYVKFRLLLAFFFKFSLMNTKFFT